MANKLVTTIQIVRYNRKAQSTLELALAIVGIFILLLGSLKIFFWANNRFIMRQEDYENSPDYGRVKAGSSSDEVGLRESTSPYPKLDILGNYD